MKKSICPIVIAGLCCVTSISSARDIDQGTIEINGGLDLSISSAKLEPESGGRVDIDTKTINLGGLYYVAQNFGLGFSWDYTSTDIESNNLSAETSTSIFGPAALYNVSINEDMSLRFLGAFLISSSDADYSGSNDGFGWGLGGGLSYFISDHVSVNGTVQYVYLKLEDDDTGVDMDSNGFGAGIGLSVYLF